MSPPFRSSERTPSFSARLRLRVGSPQLRTKRASARSAGERRTDSREVRPAKRRGSAYRSARQRQGSGTPLSLSALVAACLWLVTALGPATARADEWLVLPTAVGPRGEPTVTSREAAQALTVAAGGEGARALAVKLARARFEQRGSTAPIMVSHTDLDALARDAQMALYHVASGLPARARKDVERALERADKVLETLNREALAAQQLLDACLYLVRAHLQAKDRRAAREQALECKRLVPDIEPDGTMHPPDVIGIAAEAEAELRLHQPGSLRIESEPPGCAVYVNGRNLGNAPLELAQLSPGEYRVQAECEEGEAGRVHRVTIGSTRVVKRIDTRFDAAVQTAFDVSLRYANAAGQSRYAYADAVEVGRIVGVPEVLLVLPIVDQPGVVQADRIRVVDGLLLSAVRFATGEAGAIEKRTLTEVVRALVDGKRKDLTRPNGGQLERPFAVAARPEKPVAPERTAVTAARASPAAAGLASATPAPVVEEGVDARDQEPASGGEGANIAGVVLGVAGGAAMIAGWGLYGHQIGLELDYSDKKDARDMPGAAAALADLDDFEFVPLAVAGAGSALLTTGLPLLLPAREAGDMPWWAIGAGALGGAAAIGGTVLLVRGGSCDDLDINRRCRDILATTRLGGMLLVHALPLVATPAIYLLRDALGERDTSLTLAPTPNVDGALLTWTGQL